MLARINMQCLVKLLIKPAWVTLKNDWLWLGLGPKTYRLGLSYVTNPT